MGTRKRDRRKRTYSFSVSPSQKTKNVGRTLRPFGVLYLGIGEETFEGFGRGVNVRHGIESSLYVSLLKVHSAAGIPEVEY